MIALRHLAVLACIAALPGCYSTVVRSGAPAGVTPVEANERWHSGFVFGIAEASGPYDLQKVCPGGWAEVRTETSFWNGLVGAFTWGLYNPQTTTIVCSAPTPTPPTPTTTTLSPGFTPPLNSAAPTPVVTLQPMRAICGKST